MVKLSHSFYLRAWNWTILAASVLPSMLEHTGARSGALLVEER